MNDFNRHKRSDKIKWVFTGIAFVLVFVMLIGMCFQLFGTGKFKPSEWFKKDDTEQIQPDGGENKTTGGAIINESANSGIKLMSKQIARAAYAENGISPQAESAHTLTATIEPLSATNKAVDWLIIWVNGNSDWAKGKTVTDYVTITPRSDGALTAVVTVLQPFAEQVKISVVSRDNSEITANCVCDYIKRLSLDILLDDYDSFVINRDKSASNVSTPLFCDYTYDIGTISGNIELSSISLALTSDSLNKIGEASARAGHNVDCFSNSEGSVGLVSAEIKKSNSADNCYDFTFYALENKYLDDIFGLVDENGHEINDVVKDYISSHDVKVYVDLLFKQSYKIGDMVLFERDIPCRVMWSDIADCLSMSYNEFVGWTYPVSGLNISDTNIVF